MTPSGTLVALLTRPLTPAESRAVVAWRYAPPFDRHDLSVDALPVLLAREPAGDRPEGYLPVLEGEELVAFACLGAEGRVPGQPSADPVEVLDVGVGVRPDRLGQGFGTAVLRQVVELAATLRPRPRRLRAAVAADNERSLAMCARVGLLPAVTYPGPGGRAFVDVVRDLPR